MSVILADCRGPRNGVIRDYSFTLAFPIVGPLFTSGVIRHPLSTASWRGIIELAGSSPWKEAIAFTLFCLQDFVSNARDSVALEIFFFTLFTSLSHFYYLASLDADVYLFPWTFTYVQFLLFSSSSRLRCSFSHLSPEHLLFVSP